MRCHPVLEKKVRILMWDAVHGVICDAYLVRVFSVTLIDWLIDWMMEMNECIHAPLAPLFLYVLSENVK